MNFLIDVFEVIIMNKTCIRCHKNLDISCFRKSGKYYRSECKECAKLIYKEWYNKNKEKRKQHNRDKAKKSYYKNREHYLEVAKAYRENHKEEIKLYKKELYKKANKDRVYKRKNIPLHIRKLKKQIRNMLYDSFKRQHKIKKEHSEEILGCDLDFFIQHLLKTYKNNYICNRYRLY